MLDENAEFKSLIYMIDKFLKEMLDENFFMYSVHRFTLYRISSSLLSPISFIAVTKDKYI